MTDYWRLGVFIGLAVLFAIIEWQYPARQYGPTRLKRWPRNWGISLLSTGLVKSVFPLGLVGLSTLVNHHQWGLFNYLDVPLWGRVGMGLLLLDGLIYAQHWLVHRVPLFWRFHRVHHEDRQLDVSSGVRFHPMEILGSVGVKSLAVVAIGIDPFTVLVFEIILNGMAMFNHANMSLSRQLERWLRWIVVTPDMHRIHHSQLPSDHHQNFGFNLSIWDRIFRTYQAKSNSKNSLYLLGLPDSNDDKNDTLLRLLAAPFKFRKR